MNWLLLTLFLLVLLFLFKNFKHHMVRKTIAFVFAIFVVFMILIFASSFFDVAGIFVRDSLVAKTGASVVEMLGEEVDMPTLDSITGPVKSALNISGSSDDVGDIGGFIRIS